MSNITPLQKAERDLENARDYVLMGAAIFSGLALSLAIKNYIDVRELAKATGYINDTITILIDTM